MPLSAKARSPKLKKKPFISREQAIAGAVIATLAAGLVGAEWQRSSMSRMQARARRDATDRISHLEAQIARHNQAYENLDRYHQQRAQRVAAIHRQHDERTEDYHRRQLASFIQQQNRAFPDTAVPDTSVPDTAVPDRAVLDGLQDIPLEEGMTLTRGEHANLISQELTPVDRLVVIRKDQLSDGSYAQVYDYDALMTSFRIARARRSPMSRTILNRPLSEELRRVPPSALRLAREAEYNFVMRDARLARLNRPPTPT